jgi:hypothetical protein
MIHLLLALFLQDADLESRIASAQKQALKENQRVLVVWGADDAHRQMLKKNREVSRKILYEYALVLADARPADLAKKLGADPVKAPWATILAADGKPLANVESPADPKAMVDLLTKHQAEPLRAKDVLDAATKRAAQEKKRVLLTFGAPW